MYNNKVKVMIKTVKIFENYAFKCTPHNSDNLTIGLNFIVFHCSSNNVAVESFRCKMYFEE